MTTFHIEQFGCRATQADAAAIEHRLLSRGYTLSPTRTEAQVVVVNTCTVTSSADNQARQAIREIHRSNPNAQIVVTGCYAQRAPEDLASLEGVAWVIGNSHKSEIPRLLDLSGKSCTQDPAPHSAFVRPEFVPLDRLDSEAHFISQGPAKILTGNILESDSWAAAPVLGGESGHTRPVLKIQDGCNNRCSYCVIPFVRGRSRSLPPHEVLSEINKLCSAGFREIVLSGINLGSYGRDLTPRVEFRELLHQICDDTPLERLRISSIEPMDSTGELIDFFASTARLARHFHLPLQSGSDRILAAMHRWYRAEHYARRVELIRERLPDAAIGADVIAGFPGETELDHHATLDFIERLPLTYLHVFSFSKRPGTSADQLTENVPNSVIKDRSRELRALGEAKSASFRASQAGRTLRVLTIRHAPGRTERHDTTGWTPALSSNYLRVRLAGEWPSNQMMNVLAGAPASSSSFLTAQVLDGSLQQSSESTT
ncbi:MAG TPA: tRNA (N(6)-L-threonylcarbamoyladenosine(37)-C(2))-methylthiotransferase MtaB [Candidatus Dormibacteraeota bacterium]|nr:tRNA (N(6)-L-threonylcarbamoyladenosine(37)-C(2))-methylthiotransferase MtaB [Candidatus Dormibacteraeota bacterium]